MYTTTFDKTPDPRVINKRKLRNLILIKRVASCADLSLIRHKQMYYKVYFLLTTTLIARIHFAARPKTKQNAFVFPYHLLRKSKVTFGRKFFILFFFLPPGNNYTRCRLNIFANNKKVFSENSRVSFCWKVRKKIRRGTRLVRPERDK